LARIDNLIGDNDSYLKQIEEFKTKRWESVNTWENNTEIKTDTSNPDSNW
jgi:hypothetical protein